MNRPNVLVLLPPESWAQQFDPARRVRLRSLSRDDDPMWLPDLTAPGLTARLAAVEVLLTGWGTPYLDEAALDRLPRLRAVMHCAGTVRTFASPAVWQRGIVVSSSAEINAEPVAEFTLAAIIMAGKKAPFLAADARLHRTYQAQPLHRGPLGNVGLTIGIVGFSRIGRRTVELVNQVLRNVRCLVVDPFADPVDVGRHGAEHIGLDEMLPQVDVLSIHAPELPSTRHMIGATQLAALPDHSTVVNTARGSLIDTAALERECRTGRLQAILDVTDPEPLPAGSPLYDLPNVMITPHVAGSAGREVLRMTDGALDELARFSAGLPLRRPVLLDDLAHTA
ncbi:hydroxyacid dehydrogenase [Actinoplanes sichuanensis]|uniref:Hydroxyacid dehydrogenase n=1 Tax=Actinoplanes sichuanensis TaxID=512349 RepID=A0ABW4ATQ8_9ACTN|nr:hydroxyacid dehydrogenase [Actinoplanes sichuanensis]BEL04419.1 hydroxyacid dehydrogenase [Actinoplanes sichuanensis]